MNPHPIRHTCLDNGAGATLQRGAIVFGATTPGWGGLAMAPPYCHENACGEGWNHFLFALMFLSDPGKQTIPVGLNTLMSADSVDLGALAAGGIIAAVPVVIVFAFIQKWLITGFSAGAVKG